MSTSGVELLGLEKFKENRLEMLFCGFNRFYTECIFII